MNDPTTIIIAPHLEYPTRNGADIYVDRLGCHFSEVRTPVQILGASTVTIYKNGLLADQQHFANQLRPKPVAALRTLIFNSHYLLEKFLTGRYRMAARRLIAQNPGCLIVYSYISSASLKLNPTRAVILTHNDEPAYYRNQRQNTIDPLLKLTTWISEKWLIHFLRQHSKDYLFAHITESDLAGFECQVPGHEGIVVPPGVELLPLPNFPAWDGKIRLLFCGTLNGKMNYDALAYFADSFFLLIQARFLDRLEIWVAGSKPDPAVSRLCRHHGWKLFPNLSNDALRDLYGQATLGILPFPYTTGAKLKLLNFLAAGLPVLATRNMLYLPDQDFRPNLYSDRPRDWLDHLEGIASTGVRLTDRVSCQKFVSPHDWKSIASDLNRALIDFEL